MLELSLRPGQYIGVHIRRGDKGERQVGNTATRTVSLFLQCQGEVKKLKQFQPIDILIKLCIICQETGRSLQFMLQVTPSR